MKTSCPRCSAELELDAETLALVESVGSYECPACAMRVSMSATHRLAGVRVKTDEEIAQAATPPPDKEESAAALRLWRGVNRNVLILGAAAILLLGGLVFFIASRMGGNIFRTKQDLTHREVSNEYLTRLIAAGTAKEQDLAEISDAHPWGTSLIGVSREPLDWHAAEDLARRTAAEVLEIPADGAAGPLAGWLERTWPDELGKTAWIRHEGRMKVIDSPDIGEVTTPERPRRVFLVWRDFLPGGWSWTIEPRFDEALPFAPCGLARVRMGKVWGLIDQGGHFVLEPEFDEIGEYSEHGSARLRKGDKWGIADDKGRVIAKPEWDDVQDLIHGFVPVLREGKWGYADASGKLAIPCEWDDAWRFSAEGFAVVTRDDKRGFIDRTGKVIVEPEWDGAVNFAPEGVGLVRRGDGWGMIDTSGRLLCQPVYGTRWKDRRFDLGFLPVWQPTEEGPRYGLLGLDGKPLIGGSYTMQVPFDGGIILQTPEKKSVLIGAGGKRLATIDGTVGQFSGGFAPFVSGGRTGSIDTSGNIVIPAEWDDVRAAGEDTFAVKRNGKWGYADRSGKVILEPAWERAGIFHDGVAAVSDDPSHNQSGRRPRNWTLIDRSGRKIYGPVGAYNQPAFRNGYFEIYLPGVGRRRVDTSGKISGPNQYDRYGTLPDGFAFSENDRPGRYRNRHGEAESTDLVYPGGEVVMPDVNPAADFSSDYIPYALPPKYGLIDTAGKVLAEPQWDEVRILSPDWVWVRAGAKCGLADKTGKVVIPPEWDELEVLAVDSGSLAENGERVILGAAGQRILSPWVRARDGKKAAILRTDGKEALRLVAGEGESPLALDLEAETSVPEELAGAEYVDFYGPDRLMLRKRDGDSGWLWYLYEPATRDLVVFKDADTFRWNWNSAAQEVIWMLDSATSDWLLMDRRGGYLRHKQTPRPDGWGFQDGRALLEKPGGRVFVDRTGKVLPGGPWEQARDFSEERAAVMKKGKWGFIDTGGKLVAEPEWEEVRDFELGLAAVKAENGWWGFIGPDGKPTIPPVWNEVGRFARIGTDPTGKIHGQERDVVPVMFNSVWGCIDRTGALVVDPKHFEPTADLRPLFHDEGLTASRYPRRVASWRMDDIDSKATAVWGFSGLPVVAWSPADGEGRRVDWRRLQGEPRYEAIYSDDKSPVLEDGSPVSVSSWRHMNKYFGMLPFVGVPSESKSAFPQQKKWGEPWYDAYRLDPFSGGRIPARTPEQKYALLRLDGKEVVPPLYDRIAWVAPGIAAAWSSAAGGLVDREGNWIFRDSDKTRIARFGAKNAKSTETQHRRGLIAIEDPPKWGYAKLNR